MHMDREQESLVSRRAIFAAPALVAAAAIPQALAAEEPVTLEMLESYSAWLWYERRLLCEEMYPGFDRPERFIPMANPGAHWHIRFPAADPPLPSARAAKVLTSVGCPWRGYWDASS